MPLVERHAPVKGIQVAGAAAVSYIRFLIRSLRGQGAEPIPAMLGARDTREGI